MKEFDIIEEKQSVESVQFTDRPLFKICACIVFIGLVVAAVLIWCYATPLEPTPVIQTVNGPIQGNIDYSRDGLKYWRFLGVPYAEPPVDHLKFLAPQPIQSWNETKQVTSYPNSCAQFDIMLTSTAKGQLDCLYLNVFVNVENGINGSKPVLVYIHGGAFISGGSKIYQPDFLMDQDIVLVTINYRLGPYGFLNLGNDREPHGNSGLLDQLMALKWVQQNIRNFGGDPNRVTLFGESAGAVATHFQVISPLAQGLFHKAIIQSGSAVAPFGFGRKPKAVATEFAKRLECDVQNSSDLLPCYENADWKKLVMLQQELLNPLGSKLMFGPTLDGNFIEKTPQEYLKTGNVPKIPVMFGVNHAEGAILTARFEAYPELIEKLDKEWFTILHNLLAADKPFDYNTALKIRQKYFGNASSFTEDVDGFKRNLTDLLSDVGFFEGVHNSAIYHAKAGAPVYLYYYNYTSKIMPGLYSVFRCFRKDDWLPAIVKIGWTFAKDWISEYIFGGAGSRPYGVNHGEDIFQLFRIDKAPKFLSWFDSDFSRDFVKVIVDFANDTEPLKFRDLEWPTINDGLNSGVDNYSMPYMVLDTEDKSGIISEPFTKRVRFWNKLRGEEKD